MPKKSAKEQPAVVRLRCGKGHEYVGEALPLTISAAGAMARVVLICPFCLLALAQGFETHVVPAQVPVKK